MSRMFSIESLDCDLLRGSNFKKEYAKSSPGRVNGKYFFGDFPLNISSRQIMSFPSPIDIVFKYATAVTDSIASYCM